MCHYYRTEFRCKHTRDRIAPHKGGGVLGCEETSANVSVTKATRDCPRCVTGKAAPPPSRAGVNGITAKMSGIQVSAPPRALPPKRPSARYAETVKLIVAARKAQLRAAVPAAAATGAGAKKPNQAAASPALRIPVATRGAGAPVVAPGVRASGGKAVGGAPPTAASKAPATRGGQVGNKAQARVVAPGTSRS